MRRLAWIAVGVVVISLSLAAWRRYLAIDGELKAQVAETAQAVAERDAAFDRAVQKSQEAALAEQKAARDSASADEALAQRNWAMRRVRQLEGNQVVIERDDAPPDTLPIPPEVAERMRDDSAAVATCTLARESCGQALAAARLEAAAWRTSAEKADSLTAAERTEKDLWRRKAEGPRIPLIGIPAPRISCGLGAGYTSGSGNVQGIAGCIIGYGVWP